jgi:hypothetical protein
MRDIVIRVFKYLLALFVGSFFVGFFNMIKVGVPDSSAVPIFAIFLLSLYYFSLVKIARGKNRSPLNWVIIGTFLSPLAGFSVLLFSKLDKTSCD